MPFSIIFEIYDELDSGLPEVNSQIRRPEHHGASRKERFLSQSFLSKLEFHWFAIFPPWSVYYIIPVMAFARMIIDKANIGTP
tara:strand:- start:45 stop:293 length:249 start_codon:yes stop_codon:yes gene_type:complete